MSTPRQADPEPWTSDAPAEPGRGGVGTGASGENDPARQGREATFWVNRSVDTPEAPAQAHTPPPDPAERCPASGLSTRSCIASDLCDCFPDELDRWGLHPERFHVVQPDDRTGKP
jgi:hypothetical protein